MGMKKAYAEGQLLVIAMQQRLRTPPEPRVLRAEVEKIIRKVGLKGTIVENYFRLWAICALKDQEPLCRFWKEDPRRRRRHGRKP
jgi:hypothetical protein